MILIILLILGILLFLSGIVMRYMVNRRRFYRRGVGGLQHFDNYEKAVGTSCVERLAKIIGFIFIVIGLFLIVGYFATKDNPTIKKIEQTRSK